jgi:hypothetical protein
MTFNLMTQHNGIQRNDIQCHNIHHNDIPHNDSIMTLHKPSLSIMAFNIGVKRERYVTNVMLGIEMLSCSVSFY